MGGVESNPIDVLKSTPPPATGSYGIENDVLLRGLSYLLGYCEPKLRVEEYQKGGRYYSHSQTIPDQYVVPAI